MRERGFGKRFTQQHTSAPCPLPSVVWVPYHRATTYEPSVSRLGRTRGESAAGACPQEYKGRLRASLRMHLSLPSFPFLPSHRLVRNPPHVLLALVLGSSPSSSPARSSSPPFSTSLDWQQTRIYSSGTPALRTSHDCSHAILFADLLRRPRLARHVQSACSGSCRGRAPFAMDIHVRGWLTRFALACRYSPASQIRPRRFSLGAR